jgi:hypothetical protein
MHMEHIDDMMQRAFGADDPEARFEFREAYWLQAKELLEAEERRRRRIWWWRSAGCLAGFVALAWGGWWWMQQSASASASKGASAPAITQTTTPNTNSNSTSTNDSRAVAADTVIDNASNSATSNTDAASSGSTKVGSTSASKPSAANQSASTNTTTTSKNGFNRSNSTNQSLAQNGGAKRDRDISTLPINPSTATPDTPVRTGSAGEVTVPASVATPFASATEEVKTPQIIAQAIANTTPATASAEANTTPVSASAETNTPTEEGREGVVATTPAASEQVTPPTDTTSIKKLLENKAQPSNIDVAPSNRMQFGFMVGTDVMPTIQNGTRPAVMGGVTMRKPLGQRWQLAADLGLRYQTGIQLTTDSTGGPGTSNLNRTYSFGYIQERRDSQLTAGLWTDLSVVLGYRVSKQWCIEGGIVPSLTVANATRDRVYRSESLAPAEVLAFDEENWRLGARNTPFRPVQVGALAGLRWQPRSRWAATARMVWAPQRQTVNDVQVTSPVSMTPWRAEVAIRYFVF